MQTGFSTINLIAGSSISQTQVRISAHKGQRGIRNWISLCIHPLGDYIFTAPFIRTRFVVFLPQNGQVTIPLQRVLPLRRQRHLLLIVGNLQQCTEPKRPDPYHKSHTTTKMIRFTYTHHTFNFVSISTWFCLWTVGNLSQAHRWQMVFKPGVYNQKTDIREII